MDSVDVWKALHINRSVATFFMNTSRYHAAIEFYKELLTLVKVVGNLPSSRQDRVEMTIYNRLADAYFRIGNYFESKANAKAAFRISQKIVDKMGEITSCHNLFWAFKELGRYDKTIKYLEKALQVSREIGDAEAEAEICCYLGIAHHALGQMEKAMSYQIKSLKVSKELGHRMTEEKALTYLGNLFLALGKVRTSVQKFDEALKVSEEIGDGCFGASILLLLGGAFQSLGEYDKSIEYYQKSLRVSEETHDIENEGRACCRLGYCLFLAKRYDEAIKYLEKALEIAKAIGDKRTKEEACNAFVRIHLALGQHEKATVYKEQATESITETGARKVTRSLALLRLALDYAAGGNMQQACDLSSESIRLYESEREPLDDEYKLSLGDMYHSIAVYKNHCRHLIALGRVRDALCTAEQGRARVMGELLAKRSAIQQKVEPVNEDSLSSVIGELRKGQVLVFMSVHGNTTLFWAARNREGLVIRARRESSDSNVLDLVESITQEFQVACSGPRH